MVGLVLVAHGSLALEFVRTTGLIQGRPLERSQAVSIDALEDPDLVSARIEQAVKTVDDGDGVLIITDMFGGTPSNVALSLLSNRVEVVSGMNLPMVMVMATQRDGMSLRELADNILKAGRENISRASDFLSQG